MNDFLHIVVVLATLSGPDGQWQEPQSGYKRGFTEVECKAAAGAVPAGARTSRGALVLVSMCVPALAPDEPKQEPHPDPRNKGAI